MNATTWGDWTYNPINHTLTCSDSSGELYQIELTGIESSAAICDWIFQVLHKTWATPQRFHDVVRAIDTLLQPQANYCSRGVEQGPVDVQRILEGAEA